MVCTSLSLLVCPPQCPRKPTYPCSYTPGTQECPLGQRTHFCSSVAPPWQPCSHAGPRCALSPGVMWILARNALPATGTNAQSEAGGRRESACSRLPSSPVIVPAIHGELEDFAGEVIFVQSVVERLSSPKVYCVCRGPFLHPDTIVFSVVV